MARAAFYLLSPWGTKQRPNLRGSVQWAQADHVNLVVDRVASDLRLTENHVEEETCQQTPLEGDDGKSGSIRVISQVIEEKTSSAGAGFGNASYPRNEKSWLIDGG